MPGLRIGRGFQLFALTLACAAFAGTAAAQDMPAPPIPAAPPTPQIAEVPQPATPPAAAPAAQSLSQAQLNQLVAPIALYPDPLLSQVLMAATYPLEIVEAARWVHDSANQALKGDALTEALKAKNWDPSVMALVPFPNLLAILADKVEWTEQLGNAFLAQQDAVMSAVQRLRHQAMLAGNLKATPQCHCVIQTSGETISILPIDTSEVCIPVYNPTLVYGAWPEPAYPPYVLPGPPGFVFEPDVAIAFVPVIELAEFGPLWGWGSIDWGHRRILVENPRFAAIAPGRPAFAGGVWQHDPAHRGAVAYRDPAVTERFGTARVAAVTAAGRETLARETGFGGRMATLHPGGFGPAVEHRGFASPAVVRGPGGHAPAMSRAGGIARAPGSFRGGVPIGHAQFSPGGPHGFAGGPHGTSVGGPHGGGPHGGEDHRH